MREKARKREEREMRQVGIRSRNSAWELLGQIFNQGLGPSDHHQKYKYFASSNPWGGEGQLCCPIFFNGKSPSFFPWADSTDWAMTGWFFLWFLHCYPMVILWKTFFLQKAWLVLREDNRLCTHRRCLLNLWFFDCHTWLLRETSLEHETLLSDFTILCQQCGPG